MSYQLDWVRDLVDDPLPEPSPGQESLNLFAISVKPCGCGGNVTVETDGDVAEAVARHRMSNRHREWLVIGGMDIPSDPEMFGRLSFAADLDDPITGAGK